MVILVIDATSFSDTQAPINETTRRNRPGNYKVGSLMTLKKEILVRREETQSILKGQTRRNVVQRVSFQTRLKNRTYLISSFCRVQNIVCFLLGNSPASDLYMPTFRNTLSVPSS